MGTDSDVRRLEALARSFPSLRRLPAHVFDPWDASRFAEYCVPMSSGEKEAALLVPSVWNSAEDWSASGLVRAPEDDPMRGRFDVHRALAGWDRGHKEAFAAWVAAPWWC
jgi:hypothetical protein